VGFFDGVSSRREPFQIAGEEKNFAMLKAI